MRSRLFLALGVLTAAGCFWYSWRGLGIPVEFAVVPWLYVATGLVAWHVRPDNPTGKLMLAAGAALQVGFQQMASPTLDLFPLLWTIGSALEPAWLPALAYLVLAFPTGRLPQSRDRVHVVAAVCFVLLFSVVASLFYDPIDDGCLQCPEGINLIEVEHPGPALALVRDALHAVPILPLRIAIMVWFVLLIGIRWRQATGPARRVLNPVFVPMLALLVAVIIQQAAFYFPSLGSLYTAKPEFAEFIRWVATAAAILLPVSFLVGLARVRARRALVGELVRELGDLPPPERFQDALARALGDPHLQIARWDSVRGVYVDALGADLVLPEAGAPRVAAFLERDGTPLAVVVHDQALLDEDRNLLDSVSAAARLAVDNERLQAELRAQLEEVRASRARIVSAGDEGRRRLERDLHDGAQQRLASLALEARLLESQIAGDPAAKDSAARIAEGLVAALRELRELATGIHPTVLTDQGLGSALQSLVERSAIPARLLGTPSGRYGGPVEAAVYFVASEALANATKHSRASEIRIAVTTEDGHLRVEVTDDGVGGADAARGTGLLGLADRVAAVGGRLEVRSGDGAGTTITAELPCAPS